ncbi:reverse transcriptase [Lasius niger]|uniref:Reverse transcriptase n=1 Tax=Lasius niger TaxID=67767 RepID=A0A0J7K485_LASNI|nr:reverse transcriptase [Lasius niger]
MDVDAFTTSIHCALLIKDTVNMSLEERLGWISATMEEACDSSMPRSNFRPPKRMYWWSEDIAEQRRLLVRCKRRISRLRGRTVDQQRRVGEALEYHRVPSYLVAIIRDYFRDRRLIYYDQDVKRIERTMSGGVPQGSVLGPLLWNIMYDVVLRTAFPSGCQVVCYADDTLVIA